MRPGRMENDLCWSVARLVMRTVVGWTDDQSTGEIGVLGSHHWCNWLLHAARRVLWDNALQQPADSPSDPS
jgi:hypothetical protein